MPLEALYFYLLAKHEHEFTKDNYMADMARYAAWTKVQNGDGLPRYFDLITPEKVEKITLVEDEDVFRVFDEIAKGE